MPLYFGRCMDYINKKTAFIGHRNVYYEGKVLKRLEAAVGEQIKNGCKSFIMGTHGDFDALALSVCKKARKTYRDIYIEVVLTSYHTVEQKDELHSMPYADVETFMYDVDNTHFKRRIIVSNRKMIDECDTLICYVDERQYRSGAKKAMNYAKRNGVKIINIFRADDFPTFGMTGSERKAYWAALTAPRPDK